MKSTRKLWTSVGALVAVAASLITVLGVFWVLEIAPLLFFVSVGIAYSVLSNQPHRTSSPGASQHSIQRAGNVS